MSFEYGGPQEQKDPLDSAHTITYAAAHPLQNRQDSHSRTATESFTRAYREEATAMRATSTSTHTGGSSEDIVSGRYAGLAEDDQHWHEGPSGPDDRNLQQHSARQDEPFFSLQGSNDDSPLCSDVRIETESYHRLHQASQETDDTRQLQGRQSPLLAEEYHDSPVMNADIPLDEDRIRNYSRHPPGLTMASESEGDVLTAHNFAEGYDRYGFSPGQRVLSDFGSVPMDSPLDIDSDSAGGRFPALTRKSSAEVYHLAGGRGQVHGSAEASLQRARSGLGRMSRSIKRASRRILNAEKDGPSGRHIGHQRIDESDEESADEGISVNLDPSAASPSTPSEIGDQTLRGKSLGLLGPQNSFRKAMASLLSHWWIEPLILSLIVANLVIVVVQSAPNVYRHPRSQGYTRWEDLALLGIFVLFTIEVVARIVVSGLIVNPPQMYEPADAVDSPNLNDKSTVTETGNKDTVRSPRDQISRSNTKDVFMELGNSLKTKASSAVYVRPNDEFGRATNLLRGPSVAPRRADHRRMGSADYLSTFRTESSDLPAVTQFTSDADATQGSNFALRGSDPAAFMKGSKAPFVQAILQQRAQAAHHAYLRHSWNRIDLIAVISFWLMFCLSISRQEQQTSLHLFIFRALSVLRASRLLAVTSGTTTILNSLKQAGPLLLNVAAFTVFFMTLTSIIGVQSFKGSYRRACVWMGDQADPVGSAGLNYTLNQPCGGYIDSSSGRRLGHISLDKKPSSPNAKGYLCPLGQICIEFSANPQQSYLSYDNIFASLLQTIVVISVNGWSNIMYNMIDADYFVACIYFIFAVVLLNLILANLFVATITSTFSILTGETKRSAFAAQKVDVEPEMTEQDTKNGGKGRRRANDRYRRIWGYTRYAWLALIIADLAVQASQASHHTRQEQKRVLLAETYFTVAFDVEVLLRFLSFVVDGEWRAFFKRRRNLVDLGLAIITSLIQIPALKNSKFYPWLTFFQLARFYRVISAIPRIELLLYRVFGSMAGLFNMILFLLITIGLSAVIAAQLFRGDIPQENDGQWVEMTFKDTYNSFLAMYQIFSSENWTDVLNNALSNEGQFQQAVIAGIFLCGWFLFANFIVLQLFIGLINENFSVAESQKRREQLLQFLRRAEAQETSLASKILHKLSPYRYLRERNEAVLSGAKEQGASFADRRKSLQEMVKPANLHSYFNRARRFLRLDSPEDSPPVPLDSLHARHFRQSVSGENTFERPQTMHSRSGSKHMRGGSEAAGAIFDDTIQLFHRERRLTRMRTDLGLSEPLSQAQVDAEHTARAQHPRILQAQLINSNPSYDKSLWLFSNRSPIRRFCQSLVPPSYGERLFGRQCDVVRHGLFQVAIFLAIAGSVISAGIATPVYRRAWYERNGLERGSWFTITEASLAVFFIVEAFVKIIADGFAFAPNAYMLSMWNALDLFVLGTLIINVTSELVVIGGVSRFTRSLKAFRALRLINLSSRMRETFHAFIASAGRIADAAILAILYIVPYAVWGQNLFAGLLYSCNDSSGAISTKVDCAGEFSASPMNWEFLAPRVWANPAEGSVYSFDDFRSSLLILFEIISLEGWINVMTTTMSIVGIDRQLQNDSTIVNSIFFLIYNLLGAIFVLALFVSIIIDSFQTFSGAALQTTQQRQWIDLKRLILRQRPSSLPTSRPHNSVRAWCYTRAVQKHGWWARSLTGVYILNVIVLMTSQYKDSFQIEGLRDFIYLLFAAVYLVDIVVRLAGLGWKSFRSNWWNLYDLAVVLGVVITTIPLLQLGKFTQGNQVNIQIQKFFLVAITFKLVQRSNALNQLFKTAVSSLPAIVSLLLLWLTAFLVWAIMMIEVFSLTKWGPNETYTKNFSTLARTLVFLSMMSTGEGWNQYMHDYTLQYPNCTDSDNYLNTDCGSAGWAYFLFCSWNILSMYVMLNLFTATVIESFSYVMHLGGKPMLSRDQLRAYKKVWARFDEDRTGYLAPAKIVPFLRNLNGVLEVRIYPSSASVATLRKKADATLPPGSPSTAGRPSRERGVTPSGSTKNLNEPSHFMWPPSVRSDGRRSAESSGGANIVNGLDVDRLRRAISKLDGEDIAWRRVRFNRIYNEALLVVSKHKGGIHFTDMLLILAHHKLIDDAEALEVGETIERRALLERVDHKMELERVRGMMATVWLRKRFCAIRAEASSSELPTAHLVGGGGLPTIVLDPSPSKPRHRPDLNLDLSDTGTSFNTRPRTPEHASGHTLSHLSPHASPRMGASSTEIYAGSAAQPFVRVSNASTAPNSPSSESFESSAWGRLARRLSNISSDVRPTFSPVPSFHIWQNSTDLADAADSPAINPDASLASYDSPWDEKNGTAI